MMCSVRTVDLDEPQWKRLSRMDQYAVSDISALPYEHGTGCHVVNVDTRGEVSIPSLAGLIELS